MDMCSFQVVRQVSSLRGIQCTDGNVIMWSFSLGWLIGCLNKKSYILIGRYDANSRQVYENTVVISV